MSKLEKLSAQDLKSILLKDLYYYRKEWYNRYLQSYSDMAFKEFTKAKTLIKDFENWEDQSDQNRTMVRAGLHTWNDYKKISSN